MMKNIKIISYITIALCMIFVSCSQDEVNQVEDKQTSGDLHKVIFKVAGLDVEYGEFGSTRSSSLAQSKIEYLQYWVYKYPFTGVVEPVESKVVEKSKFSENIELNLPEGNYKIYFYASDRPVDARQISMDGIPVMHYTGYEAEGFKAEKEFSVSAGKELSINEITLARMLGRIELVIEDLDKLPADIQSISISYAGNHSTWAYDMWRSVYPSGFSFMEGQHSFSVLYVGALIYCDPEAPVEDPCQTDDYTKMFPTILRSEFGKITKDNPIIINIPPNRDNEIQLLIQGSKDEKYYPFYSSIDPLHVQNDGKIVFTRVVTKKISIQSNQIVKYTGKIGSFDANMPSFDVEYDWNEVNTPIDE